MKKTYSEKYKAPQWQKKRLEIMSRDGFRCTNCECEDSTLAVHHSYYVAGRDPWQYPDWSLRTLCDICHEIAHAGGPEEDSLLVFESSIQMIIANQMAESSGLFELCRAILEFLQRIDVPEDKKIHWLASTFRGAKLQKKEALKP